MYEQDPILMRDFRTIRRFEAEWKEAQRQLDEAKAKLGQSGDMPTPTMGGGIDLESLLDELADA